MWSGGGVSSGGWGKVVKAVGKVTTPPTAGAALRISVRVAMRRPGNLSLRLKGTVRNY